MKIAIIIGHSEESQGASNKNAEMTEFIFNRKLAEDIAEKLTVDYEIVYRDSYKDLPGKVNDTGADIAVSFHCNAYDTKASGTETLFYHKSRIGKLVAKVFQSSMVGALDLKNRGIKPKEAEDRGGYLLECTTMPCIIVEPFFIDNNNDYRAATKRYNKLVEAFVSAIEMMGYNY